MLCFLLFNGPIFFSSTNCPFMFLLIFNWGFTFPCRLLRALRLICAINLKFIIYFNPQNNFVRYVWLNPSYGGDVGSEKLKNSRLPSGCVSHVSAAAHTQTPIWHLPLEVTQPPPTLCCFSCRWAVRLWRLSGSPCKRVSGHSLLKKTRMHFFPLGMFPPLLMIRITSRPYGWDVPHH